MLDSWQCVPDVLPEQVTVQQGMEPVHLSVSEMTSARFTGICKYLLLYGLYRKDVL